METKIDNIFIIHRQQDKVREEHLNHLIKKLKKISSCNPIIIEPESWKEDTSELICIWSKAKWKRQGCISLYHTYKKILEKVVDDKLNKVLILEDDAVLKEWGELPIDKHIVFLLTINYNGKQISNIANYYHNWNKTEELLLSMSQYYKKKNNRFKSLDIEFSNLKEKYELKYGYLNYFWYKQFKSTLGNDKYYY